MGVAVGAEVGLGSLSVHIFVPSPVGDSVDSGMGRNVGGRRIGSVDGESVALPNSKLDQKSMRNDNASSSSSP